MTIPENSKPKSMFASIDKRSESFADDPELAQHFTRMVRDRVTDFAENIGVVSMIHLSEGSEIPEKDVEDNKAFRRYAIWSENENLFGAWVFFSVHDVDEIEDDEILYPHILGGVVKKSHQIMEDVYYIEKINLPVEWVTYHNAQ